MSLLELFVMSYPTATLLLSCPDRPGIAAAVTSYLFERGTNVVHAEQHVDVQAGIFFQRVEVEIENLSGTLDEFEIGFAVIAESFAMEFKIRLSTERPRVAILCSKQGHCTYDLLARWSLGEIPAQLAFVASNHETLREPTERAGYDFHHLPVDPANKELQQETLRRLLVDNDIDLVIMARYMQVLPARVVDLFPSQIINIHHSFLPAFPGSKPYHQAHARGVKLIGVTAHYATVALDEGPIIEQEVIRVTHRHSPEELVQKGRDLETIVLARAVKAHINNQVLVYGNKTVVFG
ncbi:MAG: formyltetrahydrofolate deformylase [Candidatus Poriferisodalaceae bacterium]